MTWIKSKLRSLSGWIYSELGGDLVELTRKANKLLTTTLVEPPISLVDERRAWLGRMATLEASAELQWLLASCMAEQKELTFQEATTKDHFTWGKGSVNGWLILKDKLTSYRTELEDLNKRTEAFDPHQPL